MAETSEGHTAAGHHTGRVPVDQGGAEVAVMVRPKWETDLMSPASSIRTAGTSHRPWTGPWVRDRPLAVDLTEFARQGGATQEGGQVDPDHHRAGRWPVDQVHRVGISFERPVPVPTGRPGQLRIDVGIEIGIPARIDRL